MTDYVLEGPRWGTGGLGTAGGIVTWALDGTVSASFTATITAAFAAWASYANITFQQVSSTVSAQIDFTMGAIDGLDNILGETSYYYSGGRFSSADVEFDSGEGWHFSGSQIVSTHGVNFFVVALHEIGHALGLDHYNAAPAVMNAYINSSVTNLTQSDIDGIQALYGHAIAPPTTNPFGSIVHDVNSAGGEVFALYDAILNRQPDTFGLEGWASALAHGTSLHDLAAGILNSSEGQSHLGAVSNADFVEQLYETALHRHADPLGAQSWVSALDHGTSRADVIIGVAFSAENVGGLQPALDAGIFTPNLDASGAARLYYGLLGRAPDAGGLNGWTGVAQASSLGNVAAGIMTSPEFLAGHTGMSDAQFVDSLYVGALGRHTDPIGLQGWTHALATGTSRADVAVGISESAEAQNHLQPVIEHGWILA